MTIWNFAASALDSRYYFNAFFALIAYSKRIMESNVRLSVYSSEPLQPFLLILYGDRGKSYFDGVQFDLYTSPVTPNLL
jgi:hypothetical protein